MFKVEKNMAIAAPVEKVWLALTNEQAIAAWMGDGTVEVDLRISGEYRFFDRQTTGRFLRIQPLLQLDYTWRQSEWKKGWPDSVVHWTLAPAGEGTQVSLTHDAFPNEKERAGHD